ncbi:hypothetical protein, partial [Collimonas sp. OK412]|uniref:hypothetical protein n=1 Tax=Collimonas sp. (strain OK412) TaxID=1801619 RepID=UPI001C3182C1
SPVRAGTVQGFLACPIIEKAFQFRKALSATWGEYHSPLFFRLLFQAGCGRPQPWLMKLPWR